MTSETPEAPAIPEPPAGPTFRDLKLPEWIVDALSAVGYEAPSPIQAQTIPSLLEGRDVLGMAQTGTGKTAAFALPVLAKVELKKGPPQALVLAPTRELAIQVAEAFQKYAANMPGFHVVPIYGGQSYNPQLAALRRGAHVVVGTPGRVIDHMEKGTLKLHELRFVVLDEADEMLRMGFIDDVEKILRNTPDSRQVALFSATMPSAIRRIAQTYLKNPAEITVKAKTSTVSNTRQRWVLTHYSNKLDALTRLLEAEEFDGMIIFARTKNETVELSSKLEARGYASAPLNGDIDQRTRERTVARLKNGELDIIVATDVAARGLDVERISHVINYEMPTDTESYVHRIGRTGRAGRKGEAILFVMPRERHYLKVIERATRQTIAQMDLPSAQDVNDRRLGKLRDKVIAVLADTSLSEALGPYRALIERLSTEGHDTADVAAALAHLAQGDAPLLKDSIKAGPRHEERRPERGHDRGGERSFDRSPRQDGAESSGEAPRERKPRRGPEAGKETFRVEVGHRDGVKPGNIVGAIANEAELDSAHIGRIEIFDDHSLVDLPEGMPKHIFQTLKKAWVCGKPLAISRLGEARPVSPFETNDRPRHEKSERPHHHHKKPHRKGRPPER